MFSTTLSTLFDQEVVIHDHLSGFVVYGLIDPNTKLIRYIGLTICKGLKRFKEHWRYASYETSTNDHKHNWIKSLQNKGLCFEICVLDTATTLDDLETKEEWWITYAKGAGWPLTNLHAGGKTGRPSEEGRKRISEKINQRYAERGPRVQPPEEIAWRKQYYKEHLAGFAANNKGRKRSTEECEAISKGRTGLRLSDEVKRMRDEKMAIKGTKFGVKSKSKTEGNTVNLPDPVESLHEPAQESKGFVVVRKRSSIIKEET